MEGRLAAAELKQAPRLSGDCTGLTAWRSIRQLRSAAAFDGWLKRIMVTTWLGEARRGRVSTTSEIDPASVAVHHDSTAARMDLDAALATLQPDVRLCVVLAYCEGLVHPEIVALTGIPLGTVKSHIARGAARLREILAEYGERS